MGDVLLAFGALGTDLQLAGGDLVGDDGLLSAVIISLFTNRLADPGDELPAGEPDRQGWWADATLPGGKDRIGSKLWMLRREKQLPTVVARATEYAQEALAWIVTEGRAQDVTVLADVPAQGVLRLRVLLTTNAGEKAVDLLYDDLANTYRLTE